MNELREQLEELVDWASAVAWELGFHKTDLDNGFRMEANMKIDEIMEKMKGEYER